MTLDLADAAALNLVTHASWPLLHLPGARTMDDRGLVIADSGLPCDTFNFVLRARLEPGDAESRAREAIDYYREVDRPFSWWVGPGDRPDDLGAILECAGLERAEGELAMAADLADLPAGDPAPGGLRIERVRTPEGLRDFARINAANWSPPDPIVLHFYEFLAAALLADDSPHWYYVGSVGDEAVAASELTVGGGVVGLYNITTVEAWRRRGFGSALTLRPLLDARAAGHRTAVLQAAPDGVGVYRRTGFREFGEITEYKPV